MKQLVYRIFAVLLAVLMAFSPCTVALADAVLAAEAEDMVEQLAEDLSQQNPEEAPLTEEKQNEQPEPLEEELPLQDSTEETDEKSYVFQGFPQGYELSRAELDAKALLTDLKVLEALLESQPGVDYVEDEIIVMAEDAEYAELSAVAYNGSLVSYADGVAVIRLTDASVLEAIEAAADMDFAVPAADPPTGLHG